MGKATCPSLFQHHLHITHIILVLWRHQLLRGAHIFLIIRHHLLGLRSFSAFIAGLLRFSPERSLYIRHEHNIQLRHSGIRRPLRHPYNGPGMQDRQAKTSNSHHERLQKYESLLVVFEGELIGLGELGDSERSADQHAENPDCEA